jgi:hypothetical protein
MRTQMAWEHRILSHCLQVPTAPPSECPQRTSFLFFLCARLYNSNAGIPLARAIKPCSIYYVGTDPRFLIMMYCDIKDGFVQQREISIIVAASAYPMCCRFWFSQHFWCFSIRFPSVFFTLLCIILFRIDSSSQILSSMLMKKGPLEDIHISNNISIKEKWELDAVALLKTTESLVV